MKTAEEAENQTKQAKQEAEKAKADKEEEVKKVKEEAEKKKKEPETSFTDDDDDDTPKKHKKVADNDDGEDVPPSESGAKEFLKDMGEALTNDDVAIKVKGTVAVTPIKTSDVDNLALTQVASQSKAQVDAEQPRTGILGNVGRFLGLI